MALAAVSRVTSKGQVTVPEKIREDAHISTGDRLEWRTLPSGVIEVRKVKGDLDALVGMLGEPRARVTIEGLDEALRAGFRSRGR